MYDQNANVGWVNVGTDHDTANFTVKIIRRCWSKMRKLRYTDAIVLITADATGCVYGKSRLGGSVNESGLGLPARDQHVEQDQILHVRLYQDDLLGLCRSSWYYRPRELDPLSEVLMRLLDEQYTRTPVYKVLCRKFLSGWAWRSSDG